MYVCIYIYIYRKGVGVGVARAETDNTIETVVMRVGEGRVCASVRNMGKRVGRNT